MSFERYCLACEEEEKRAKMLESKDNLYGVLAEEFPSEICFLSSFDATQKENSVNNAASRCRAVRRRLEAKSKPASARGVSSSLGAVLKAGGTQALDTCTDLVDKFGSDVKATQALLWFMVVTWSLAYHFIHPSVRRLGCQESLAQRVCNLDKSFLGSWIKQFPYQTSNRQPTPTLNRSRTNPTKK